MHTAAPPSQPGPAIPSLSLSPAAEPLPTKFERLHTEALEALRLVMNKALDSIITLPPPAAGDEDTDNPAQSPADHARTVTQRMRLALTAARDLLRYTTDGTTQPPSPGSAVDRAFGSGARESRKSPSHAQHHPDASGGRMGVPPEPPENANPTASTSPTSAPAPDSASQLLTAAGAEVPCGGSHSRRELEDQSAEHRSASSFFGERFDSPPDSQLSTHESPVPASPCDSSPIAHTSPSPDSALTTKHPALPLAPPPPLTLEERQLLAAAQRHGKRFVPFQVLPTLRAWQRYADATGTKTPFDVPRESIFLKKPKRRQSSD